MELPGGKPAATIAGPAGVLEIMLDDVADRAADAPIAVVCHPHPQFGGNLNNKVTHRIARTFRDMGTAALRFNFRGVGGSTGRYDHAQGEQEDLMAAVAWLRQRYPDAPLWLAGFSFGSAIALACWQRAGADRLLLVAPPVEHDYFPALNSADSPEVSGIPWLVVMGSADEVVAPNAVSQWVSARPHPPTYCYLDGASHFFHGRLLDLRDALQQAWGTP